MVLQKIKNAIAHQSDWIFDRFNKILFKKIKYDKED